MRRGRGGGTLLRKLDRYTDVGIIVYKSSTMTVDKYLAFDPIESLVDCLVRMICA